MAEAEQLENVLRALPYPALLLANQTRIIAGNVPAQRLFDHSLINIDLVRFLRQPEIMRMVTDEQMAGQPQMVRAALHFTRQRIYDVSFAPVSDGAGQYHIMTLLDVSAEIDAEKARSNFVANVSHELRSPLTAMTGLIEALQGPAKDDAPARVRFLDMMAEQAQRMSRLVSELLSLSTLEAREHIAPKQHIALEPVIRSVEQSLAMASPDFANRVTLSGFTDLPDVVGDKDLLTEVFQNLLENALKYSDPGTQVYITADVRAPENDLAPQRVRISIQDQGDGIEPEHMPRLTERFYRVDSGRSREMGGTGLGLAIVKHIINRHRGRMRIESEVGKGTNVMFWLNVAKAP